MKQLLEMILTVSKRTGDSCLTEQGFPGGSGGKESAYHAGDRLDPWVRKIPLEEETATHSNILAWEIPWIEEPGVLWSMGSQRVEDDGATKEQQQPD